MHRSGSRTIASLYQVLNLKPIEEAVATENEIAQAKAALEHAGHTLVEDTHVAQRLYSVRRDYTSRIAALSAYLGADRTRFMPGQEQTATS